MLLCLGSFAKLLLTSVKPDIQQQDIVSTLIKAVGGSDIIGEHGKISRLVSCEANVPEDAIAESRLIYFEEVVTTLKSVLIEQQLLKDKLPLIVLALKDILKNDPIDDNVKVGKYKKSELLQMTKIEVSEYLACILIYVCSEVKNREGDNNNLIDKDYLNSFESNRHSIEIVSEPIIKSQHLECTLNRDDFEQVFIESDGAGHLENPNYNQVRLFYLDIENNKFSYDSLEDFLIDNIGYYVLSRTEMQTLKDKHKEQAACLRAIRAMNSHGHPGQKGTGNDLGEVMVYSFLEDVLGAPKILTKAEIISKSKTDGVHLLKLNNGGKDKYQLVLASSYISGDIKNAINSVLMKLNDITNTIKNERQMVDRAVLSNCFDSDTTAYLKSVLIPTKASSGRPDISYGIFIGYSLEIDPMQFDTDTYRIKAMEKMKADVEAIAPFINGQLSKIVIDEKNNIANHSFYFYFMPFNDADRDKDIIMQNLLSGGANNGTM